MPSGVTTRITHPYNLLRSTLPTQACTGHAFTSHETLQPMTHEMIPALQPNDVTYEVRRILRPMVVLARMLRNAYVFIAGRPSGQALNDLVLAATLRARGYDPPLARDRKMYTRFLATVVANQPAGLCLDVGANRGDYARTVLERTDCSVVAFEPLPSTFEQLAKLAHEHPSRFEAIEAAVGDREGTTTLHVDPANSALASTSVDVRYVPYVQPTHTVDVRLRTLDAVWDALLASRFDAITLLKIDVEGCENEVLRGAQRLLAAAPPTFVQVEMNWHHLFTGTTLRMLAAHLPGYRLLQLVPYGRGYVPRDVNDGWSNMFAFTNFVFVRRDVRLPGLT